VALVGREGMLGLTLAIGNPAAPLSGVVVGAGHALRLAATDLVRVLRASPSLECAMEGQVHAMLTDLARVATCASFHAVRERLARLLLMTSERASPSRLRLTHVTLAAMLGVQRSAVTIAAGLLQRAGLVGYARGVVSILDPAGLDHAACGCLAGARTA
jgi:CRP-like cAMP-binding protein